MSSTLSMLYDPAPCFSKLNQQHQKILCLLDNGADYVT